MRIYFFILSFLLSSCGMGGVDSVDRDVGPGTQEKKIILTLGDSLTAGYGLPENDAYPAQLESRLRSLGYDYIVQNSGVSGDTTAGLLDRLDWILEGTQPTLAIVCIGANDAFQGKSVADIEKNLRAIIEKIQKKNIPILLAGMKAPLNLGSEYGEKYDMLFSRLAKEYQVYFMPFFLEGLALNNRFNQDDRIHPTKEGYAMIVENIITILTKENLITK